ncbi:hypothetical protein COCOR_06872 [Corallococcus coralloides DSM 2259]|uniref:Uncharacterized protein n=1 Tax=Corallococcus coralloides (strain ATCC 25202 / DSM 2259 / NBRC 100086 / M2) TaxID=1144275 RepID=H8N116_CORCM|nr:hypothetical protein [Corallococcus coralloides]AFE07186.1 hypothetical protein COCOR_06872 [Corallococcus coralloides DSM 2259]
MRTGLSALEATDWSRLLHAYGRATDAPGHLRALVEGDEASRHAALSYLNSAILHQDTPCTATGPVTCVLAGLLAELRLDSGGPRLRMHVLEFLAGVVEVVGNMWASRQELEHMARYDLAPFLDADDDALYEDEEAVNAFYATALLGCAEAVPVLVEPVLASLDHPDSGVRAQAATTAVLLARMPEAFGDAQRQALALRLTAMARATTNTDERSTLVLMLGELGDVPSAFLEDASPAVRVCAAMAKGLATNEAATRELLQALEHHAAQMDDWFQERPPPFELRPRFYVLERLLERVKDFDRLLPVAVTLARITTKHCVDMEWGPLLAAAFPAGDGQVRTDAQRRFLSELVANADLWDPTFGNPGQWFRKAGLPYQRNACAERLTCP